MRYPPCPTSVSYSDAGRCKRHLGSTVVALYNTQTHSISTGPSGMDELVVYSHNGVNKVFLRHQHSTRAQQTMKQ